MWYQALFGRSVRGKWQKEAVKSSKNSEKYKEVLRRSILTNPRVCQVIQSGSSAGLQNKHQPMKQYVTRKNHIAYRGKEVKMWCIFGGTPLPEIRYV